MNGTVRVVIVSSTELVRYALRQAVGNTLGIAIIGEATTPEGALDQARRSRAHVLVYGASGSDRDSSNCLALARGHVSPTRLLVLSDHVGSRHVLQVASLGRAEVLGPEVSREHLVRAIRRAGTESILRSSGARVRRPRASLADAELTPVTAERAMRRSGRRGGGSRVL